MVSSSLDLNDVTADSTACDESVFGRIMNLRHKDQKDFKIKLAWVRIIFLAYRWYEIEDGMKSLMT